MLGTVVSVLKEHLKDLENLEKVAAAKEELESYGTVGEVVQQCKEERRVIGEKYAVREGELATAIAAKTAEAQAATHAGNFAILGRLAQEGSALATEQEGLPAKKKQELDACCARFKSLASKVAHKVALKAEDAKGGAARSRKGTFATAMAKNFAPRMTTSPPPRAISVDEGVEPAEGQEAEPEAERSAEEARGAQAQPQPQADASMPESEESATGPEEAAPESETQAPPKTAEHMAEEVAAKGSPVAEEVAEEAEAEAEAAAPAAEGGAAPLMTATTPAEDQAKGPETEGQATRVARTPGALLAAGLAALV